MLGRLATEAIHLIRQLIERFRERKRNLPMVFIDLEKSYDKVPREVLWWRLMKKRVPIKYIDIIKDMYDGIVANVRTYGGITSDFSITIGLHQGSVSRPFLFAIVMMSLLELFRMRYYGVCYLLMIMP